MIFPDGEEKGKISQKATCVVKDCCLYPYSKILWSLKLIVKNYQSLLKRPVRILLIIFDSCKEGKMQKLKIFLVEWGIPVLSGIVGSFIGIAIAKMIGIM
jgi:hypothetical protein